MTFRVLERHGLENALSPFRVVDNHGREIPWINRFLDRQKLRGVAVASLRSYAHDLLHFFRWWTAVHSSRQITESALTDSALLDYIRFQTNQEPPAAPASINRRVSIAERALLLEFPDAQPPRVPDFQYAYWRPFPLSAAQPRPALSRLRVRTPKRVIVPLLVDEVARFWASFRTSRDLAMVGLMILDGLRSCEIVALNRDDVLFQDSQIRVRGKRNKVRWLPLPAETAHLLDHYLRLERPPNCGAPLFVGLKGKARGRRLTLPGLRSLFRYHRLITTIRQANPHRFRHTFATDMLRGGISLPALMQLMGHSKIETTLVYVHLTPQDVYQQYARAAAQLTRPPSQLMRRRCFLHHPLEPLFEHATESLTIALSDGSRRTYEATYRGFLRYLAAHHPDVRRLDQLRREPHVLGWLTQLRSRIPPMAKITISIRVVCLHRLFDHMAWSHQIVTLLRLLTREDVPRREKKSPRPLTPEQDQLVQTELSHRKDLASTVLLLQRHTGMRIGECADLASDCLYSIAPDQWILHVPLGKLSSERWIPVDAFVCDVIQRLRALRPPETSGDCRFLIGRPRARETIIRNIRATLRNVVATTGITSRIVPHQFRHTFGTEMLRAGVSFPAVMRLLGHTDPKMTLQYLEITQPDLQREFQLARTNPRHMAPSPRGYPLLAGSHPDMPTVIDSIVAAKHVLEMFRRDLLNRSTQRILARLVNRLAKVIAELRKLAAAE